MEIKQLYALFLRSTGVTTDSRTLKGGELFFALKGENFDGNLFAGKAVEAGAAYAVVLGWIMPVVPEEAVCVQPAGGVFSTTSYTVPAGKFASVAVCPAFKVMV